VTGSRISPSRSYRRERVDPALAECNAVLGLALVCVRLGDDPSARRYIREALGLAVDMGASTRVLDCLTVEADRRLAAGDTEIALTLLGAVRRHPSIVATVVQSVDRTLSRYGLSREEIAVGLARGAGLDLDAVVAGAQADLS
jgi:hypothetical protein